MADPVHRVIPKSEWKRLFECGHVGWQKFSHSIFGQERELQGEIIESKEKCGECLLDQATDDITQCARCQATIFKGESCFVYDGELCCISRACGPGPKGHMPYVWDGQWVINGVAAGTVRTL